jgi:hypothetical protein
MLSVSLVTTAQGVIRLRILTAYNRPTMFRHFTSVTTPHSRLFLTLHCGCFQISSWSSLRPPSVPCYWTDRLIWEGRVLGASKRTWVACNWGDIQAGELSGSGRSTQGLLELIPSLKAYRPHSGRTGRTWCYQLCTNINLVARFYLFFTMIKSKRMRWAGHVAWMGEKRNAYRILMGKP